jgi:hypothetical protein
LLAIALAAILFAIVAVPSAHAEAIHPFEGTVGSGELASPAGVAVSDADGSLYVADPGFGLVRKYDAAGAPANFSALGSNGLPVSTSFVAVDISSGPNAGNIYVTMGGALQAFDASGEPADFSGSAPYLSENKITGSPSGGFSAPTAVVVDANGDIYVADFPAVSVYSPSGEYLTQVPAFNAEGLAVDSAGIVYATYAGGTAQRYTPSAFPVTGATTYSSASTGTAPSYGLATDSATGDLYVNGNGKVDQYKPAAAGNAAVGAFGAKQLGGASKAIAIDRSGGASEGSVYVSSGSQVVKFGPTPPPVAPSVESQTAIPTTTEVELRAKADPGLDALTYRFEYGPTTSYGSSTAPAEVEASEASVTLRKQVIGLTPSTTYHYRVVIENSVGTATGNDQTFLTTAPTNGRPCALSTPGCWGFEQVSPVNKGAATVQSVNTFQTSPDGTSFLYTTTGPFLEVPAESSPTFVRYLGTRGPDKWGNRALDVPYRGSEQPNFQTAEMSVVGASANLTYVIVASSRALTPGAFENGSNLYMRDTSTGALTFVAGNGDGSFVNQYTYPKSSFGIKWIADDGRSALFTFSSPLLPGAPGGALYGWTAGGGLEAKSVMPADEGGAIVPVLSAGNDSEIAPREPLPRTDALAHVYFQRFTGEGTGEGAVYVRSGNQTKLVSYSRIPGDDPTAPVIARVDSVSDGGRYLFFHTTGVRLTPDSPEQGEGLLYRYDVTDGSLDFVAAMGSLGSQGVLQTTQDGRTVAFQSPYALAPGAVERFEYGYSAKNLYVWHDGDIKFVETSEAGPFPGSTAASPATFLHLLSPDGRYLSFTDSAPSVAEAFGQENISPACSGHSRSACDVVYLYDAVTEKLTCASCSPTGSPSQGNAGEPASDSPGNTLMDAHQQQTVTDDGRVFFTTPDSLLPADSNGANDVYEYFGGGLRLVSRATQGTSAKLLDATPDGKTIFFLTNDAIVSTDTDRSVDVYATREGGGYPEAPVVATPPCSGSDCREATVPTASPPHPGSTAFVGPGNSTNKKSGRVSVSGSKSIVGPSGALGVKAPGKGKLTATGSGIKRTSRQVAKAGRYSLKVALTAQARTALAKNGKTRQKVTVSFKSSDGSGSKVTVTLTFKAPASGGGK